MKKIFLFLAVSFALFGQVNSNGDFQIWNREMMNAHFSEHWNFFGFAESRIGDNATKLYQAIIHTQFGYTPAPWIYFGVGYRQSVIRSPINSNHWEPIYSPLAHLSLFYKSDKGWQFIDRTRVQCDLQQSSSTPWIYRNRFRIIPPWTFTRLCLNPFIDNEIFIYQGSGFSEDRLCGGLLFWLRGNLSGQLYYMCRFQKPDHWIHQNVLNITLLFAY